MKSIRINPEPCTGCLNCEVVCAQRVSLCADRSASSIRICLDPFGGLHRHTYCRQCAIAQCANSCPRAAIHLCPETSAWIIDREKCIQCGTCVDACPFHAMFWWDGKPLKCNLCSGAPECVKACHFHVIHYAQKTDPVPAGIPESDQDDLHGAG